MTLVNLGDRIGWRRDGEIVASCRAARESDSLVVEELEGVDESAVEALLDAVARAATKASRVVDRHGGVLRDVIPVPVDSAAPLTLARLEQAIRDSWSAETSDRPKEWTSANPAFQQCDVTARIVQDYFGGEILIAGVVLDGVRVDRHAWNRLPSGVEVDLSREQFLEGERFEQPEVLTEFVARNGDERYALLARRVREKLDT